MGRKLLLIETCTSRMVFMVSLMYVIVIEGSRRGICGGGGGV